MVFRDPQDEHVRQAGLGVLPIAFAGAAVSVLIVLSWVSARMGPPSIAIWGVAAWVAMTVFKGPVGQALAARLSGQVPEGQSPEIAPEVYAELDELRARVAELEERVDFSERLLTKSQEEQRSK